MEAARLRSAVWATTACLLVLGAADLARARSREAVPAGAERPVSPPPGPRTTIGLDPAAGPTVAATRERACTSELGGGPHPDEDVWVFGLPAGAVAARFIAVTPAFATGDQGRVVTAVPAEGGAIVDDHGVSLAWLRLPAGWTLVGGTATIAGDADRFVLARVCAASRPSL
ncbi:hypothetical protein ABT023_22295 [Micromonospora sp. NPDC002296]|uniref:hypothetical protein n=1 Tax=Micromonospora sp. NPDC002296 TaxID=3154271 RepID=UPI003327F579